VCNSGVTSVYRPTGCLAQPKTNLASQEEPRGLVFNIMRFSLHDGPGIRTTVFLKGCPLRCGWCHNPEGQLSWPEVIYFEERCLRCGDCVRACPEGALHLDGTITTDPTLCRRWGKCVDACSGGARELAGRWMSVPDVVAEVAKDEVFYEESGGGVTISGGEPLMQAAFVEPLLAACRARRIHTVLDTCGFADPDVVRRVSEWVDLFLYDLKLMDGEKHRRFTGVKNDRIVENLRTLAEIGSQVIVRIPIIPGVNDEDTDIAAMSAFLTRVGLRRIDLLPYHRIGSDKYDRLHRRYELNDIAPPTAEHMAIIAARLSQDGFSVHVGG
jgi:pyruvate formate lyase activating enzyme